MDSVAELLMAADEAGLTLRADGDRLIVRGPRAAADVVKRLAENKSAVLAALRTDDPEREATQWAESAPPEELDAALASAVREWSEITGVPLDCLEGRHQ